MSRKGIIQYGVRMPLMARKLYVCEYFFLDSHRMNLLNTESL